MFGYAEIKGRQYRLAPGEMVKVPSLPVAEGEKYDIAPLLMFNDGQAAMFGGDCAGYTAKATVMRHGREAKIIVFKKKRRVDYRVKRGHRQGFTLLRIDEIVKDKETE